MSGEGYIYVGNFSDSLSLCVVPATSSPGEQEHLSPRWLGLTFDSRDKEALFFTALKVFNPAAAVGGRIPAEDFRRGKWDDLLAQFERSLCLATAELPMLRRLKEEYEDAVFAPDEVSVFREECLKVRSGTDDPQALAALEKLIRACDEALKEGSRLVFYSD
jgi:hypothetical protein